MARKQTGGPITASGPGVDRGFDQPYVALSFAITCASAAKAPATFYVRERGEVIARVERDESRAVFVHSTITRA